jgi:hypothetical protein
VFKSCVPPATVPWQLPSIVGSEVFCLAVLRRNLWGMMALVKSVGVTQRRWSLDATLPSHCSPDQRVPEYGKNAVSSSSMSLLLTQDSAARNLCDFPLTGLQCPVSRAWKASRIQIAFHTSSWEN